MPIDEDFLYERVAGVLNCSAYRTSRDQEIHFECHYSLFMALRQIQSRDGQWLIRQNFNDGSLTMFDFAILAHQSTDVPTLQVILRPRGATLIRTLVSQEEWRQAAYAVRGKE